MTRSSCRQFAIAAIATLPLFAMTAGPAVAQSPDSPAGSTGYFRVGDGSSRSGPQACYGLGGNTMKYRLGNECDLYAEAEYFHELPGAPDSVRFTGHVMPTYYAADSQGGDSSFKLGQLYVDVRGLPALGSATVWVGKRYYNRPDIHMLDLKYLFLDGTGAGIDGYSTTWGKLGYALFKDNDTGPASAIRNNLLWQAIPTNEGGKLDVVATLISARSTAPDVHDGWNLTLQHQQSGVFGGMNTLALQYGVGPGSGQGDPDPASGTFGGGGPGGDRIGASGSTLNGGDVRRLRLFDSIWIQPTPDWSGSAVALLQKDRASLYGGTQTWISLGLRPVYALAAHFKLQAELGTDWVLRPRGLPAEHLAKVTIAPTLALARDFWSRPELRLFITRAWWNRAAIDAVAPPDGPSANGTSVGVQVEAWW